MCWGWQHPPLAVLNGTVPSPQGFIAQSVRLCGFSLGKPSQMGPITWMMAQCSTGPWMLHCSCFAACPLPQCCSSILGMSTDFRAHPNPTAATPVLWEHRKSKQDSTDIPKWELLTLGLLQPHVSNHLSKSSTCTHLAAFLGSSPESPISWPKFAPSLHLIPAASPGLGFQPPNHLHPIWNQA